MSRSTSTLELTVVIAAYNAEDTVAAAVKSAHSAGAEQVVVVDDGSQDATALRAEQAGALVIRQPNAGASVARMAGAAAVATEFMVFLDADDTLVATGVARSIDMLSRAPQASAAGGRVVGFAGNGQGTLLPLTYSEVTVEALLTNGHGAWPPGAAVIRTKNLRQADSALPSALKPRFAEDYEMLIRLARVGAILRHDEVSMRYEMSGGKSVHSAHEALKCKEQIREHYARAWGIEIRLMAKLRRSAAANRRIARARRQAARHFAAASRLAIAYVQGGFSLLERRRSAGGSPAPVAEVFEWAAGQDDNIGDSLLRRPSLADARSRGTTLHVFQGPSTPTFDTGLGLDPRDVTYRSFRKWVFAAARCGLKGPTLLVPNAGEVKVSRRGALRIGALWTLTLLPGVRVVWMGAGVPGERTIWSIPYRLLARRADLSSFRDAQSVSLLKAGSVAPDWAFALGSEVRNWPSPATRHRLAFILRGDRAEPSAEWMAWAKRLASELELTPVFVAHVRRDNRLAAHLAGILGGDVIEFDESQTHESHEGDVRAVYRETLLAVGDRLHGLIVAATEGAVPLGWVESSGGKVGRHFDAVDMMFVGRGEGSPAAQLPGVTKNDVDDWSAALRRRVEQARIRIEETQTRADLVAPRRPST